MKLTQRLLEFQRKKPAIELDGKVHYKQTQFKYATLGQIIEKTLPVLNDVGVLMFQGIEEGFVFTSLTDGVDELKSTYRLPEINNPQDLGKWITYVKRYQLCAMLGIVGEDDVDGQMKVQEKEDEELRRVRNWIASTKDIQSLHDAYNTFKDQGKLTPEIIRMVSQRKEQLT